MKEPQWPKSLGTLGSPAQSPETQRGFLTCMEPAGSPPHLTDEETAKSFAFAQLDTLNMSSGPHLGFSSGKGACDSTGPASLVCRLADSMDGAMLCLTVVQEAAVVDTVIIKWVPHPDAVPGETRPEINLKCCSSDAVQLLS